MLKLSLKHYNTDINFLTKKMKFCSMFAGIMIVFVHSSTLNLNFVNYTSTSPINIFIQHFIQSGVARLGLPYFFIMSGFLFYRNFSLSFSVYVKKIKNRLISLGIPYVMWSLYGILLIFIIEQYIVPNFTYSGRIAVHDFTFNDFIYTLLVHPFQNPLWFLVELAKYVIISPVIYLLLKYTKGYILLIFGLLWFMDFQIPQFSIIGIFFFSLGAAISLKLFHINLYKKQYFLYIITFWLLIIMLHTYFVYIEEFQDNYFLIFLYKLSRILGVYILWFGYDYWHFDQLYNRKITFIFTSYSFFLYLFHKPILDIIRNVIFKIVGVSETTIFITFFLSPILTIILAIVIGSLLRAYVQPLYKTITGNR